MPRSEDVERWEILLPPGYKDKLDHLVAEGRRKYPNKKNIFHSKTSLIVHLIDYAWFLLETYETQSKRLKELKEELNRQEIELRNRVSEQLEELAREKEELAIKASRISEAENRICEELNMLPYAKSLWMDVVMSNIASKDEILMILKALKEADINFSEVAKVIKEEDLPGFIGWARKVKEACIRASDELAALKEEISAYKTAISRLQSAEKSLIDKLNAEIDRYDRAVMQAERACAAARDLGLYLDYISQSLKMNGADKIQDLLPEPALVIAGTILEAVAAAYGDREITIAPGPKHLFPVKVTLREIARSLAPAEAYREQQKAQMKMEVMSEAISSI